MNTGRGFPTSQHLALESVETHSFADLLAILNGEKTKYMKRVEEYEADKWKEIGKTIGECR
jgi:hypothetical protein